jgi:hypothetical protein
MGFFGVTVLTRNTDRVSELPAVRALGGDPDWEVEGLDGWRLGRLHGSDCPEDELVQAIADQTAGPVMCAYIVDSDFAWVRLSEPDQDVFDFVLHQDSAVSYGVGVDPEIQAAAPGKLLTWAGSGADPEAIAAAVAADLVFAEDAVVLLAAAVGALPRSQVRDYMFDPPTEAGTDRPSG